MLRRSRGFSGSEGDGDGNRLGKRFEEERVLSRRTLGWRRNPAATAGEDQGAT